MCRHAGAHWTVAGGLPVRVPTRPLHHHIESRIAPSVDPAAGGSALRRPTASSAWTNLHLEWPTPGGFPSRFATARTCLLFLLAAGASSPVAAQENELIPGVELGFIFEGVYVPPIAVKPLTVAGADVGLAREIEGIITRDLDYSDRFQVRDSLPPALGGEGVQYALWEQFGVDWVVTGTIETDGLGGGIAFSVELHDIVFGSLKAAATFPLPARDHPDFRLAVHSVSDALVGWVTGDRGVAATRMLFRMRAFGEENPNLTEIYVVDFDGENLRRLTWDRSTVTSPTWSPDGKRVAYSSFKADMPRIYELNLEDGQERLLVPEGHGQHDSPSYHPDGNSVAFTIVGPEPEGLFTYNIRDGCCLKYLGGGRFNDLQPNFSPDGEWLVFVSTRLRFSTPQVYLRPLAGGDDELLSPFRYGEGGFFTDPDWSPCGDRVAFAGGIGSRRQANRYHILVAKLEAGGNRLLQLTQEGNNEDPSWAPNCRHIVFTGERSYG
ncbi:MAG: hypothetical protein F4123_10770 [Gemmatimonadetes bacterium]|nr:hypothetical protein [Gemmatimonadota bacterium]